MSAYVGTAINMLIYCDLDYEYIKGNMLTVIYTNTWHSGASLVILNDQSPPK